MEPSQIEQESSKNTISEKIPFSDAVKQEYIAFLKVQGEVVKEKKNEVDFSNPEYKKSSKHASYWKALDHAAILSDGGRLLRGIEYDENGNQSFLHKAVNNRGETVGFEITWITEKHNNRSVNGEFIGVGFNNNDPTTALKLLEARHESLAKMNIHQYEISMEYRTAKVLEHLGVDLKFIEQHGDHDTASYMITF
jgi:hypothetical protein